MAESHLCQIDGCSNPSDRRGWCTRHYMRWYRNGDPVAGRTDKGAPVAFAMNAAMNTTTDECISWPFNRTPFGYPMLKAPSGTRVASRFVCELANGPAPTSEHQAAHTCGNGHLGCVNPRHLTWKTRSDNEADKLIHQTRPLGEDHPNSKLNAEAVREIRRLKGIASPRELSQKYGVSTGCIDAARAGKSWKWLE